jgi:hypothetical protein
MNDLPESRRAIHGRTYSRAWRPEDYAALERIGRDERAAHRADLVILVMFAASVAWWLWESLA